MPALNLKPAHKAVKAYFDELQAVAHLDFFPLVPKLHLGMRMVSKLSLAEDTFPS